MNEQQAAKLLASLRQIAEGTGPRNGNRRKPIVQSALQ